MPQLIGSIAPVLPDLVAGPSRHPAFAVLGVRRLRLAELADMLANLDRDPAWWRDLYEVLAAAEPAELGELGALPVPLADGRLVRGPRGLLLPGPGLEHAQSLTALGFRVVQSGAVHPLLARLGAVEATPQDVLADPAVRAAVAESYDERIRGPSRMLYSVSWQQRTCGLTTTPGSLTWRSPAPMESGTRQVSFCCPAARWQRWSRADTPFGTVSPAMLERHGADTLEAVGVLSSFSLLVAEDVVIDAPDLDLDGAREWAAEVRARLAPGGVPLVAPELLAVRDLELVDPGRWPLALKLLAAPSLRAALVEPTRVLLADGRYADVPSYTSLVAAPSSGPRRAQAWRNACRTSRSLAREPL